MLRRLFFNFSHLLLILSGLFFIVVFLVNLLPNISNPPTGDNLFLHIAVAKSILNGSFLNPPYHQLVMYPAANEVILALFLLLKIPVNLFNLLGLIVLFLSCIFVGKKYQFSTPYAIFFAIAICSSYDIVIRWSLSQTIDSWLLSYFFFTLGLLRQPTSSLKYYLFLGISIGMLLGSRFTAPGTLITILLFHYQNFLKYITLKRAIIFALLISLFGLFWYARNLIITGTPFYPQSFLFLKGAGGSIYGLTSWNVINVFGQYPNYFFDAIISEYMIWSILFIALPLYLLLSIFSKNNRQMSAEKQLILIGILNLFIYIFFPSWKAYISVVAGMRYAYPAFGAFLLALFSIAHKRGYEKILMIVTVANLSFLVLPMPYHPKLLFLYVPIISFLIYQLQTKGFPTIAKTQLKTKVKSQKNYQIK